MTAARPGPRIRLVCSRVSSAIQVYVQENLWEEYIPFMYDMNVCICINVM